MPDSMCRLAVQHGPDTVELALPRSTPVGLLLPSVVDLVKPDTLPAEEGLRWHLSRVGHGPLDEAISLHDNAVHDGELLLLATAPSPTPVRVPDDPWQVLVETRDRRSVPQRAIAAACLSASLFGVAALAWAGVVTQAIGNVMAATAIAAAAMIATVAVRRAYPDPLVVVTLGVIAVAFGGAAGFLAVPAGPSTANALLAAAVAFATSTVLIRITHCGAICLTAIATSSALTTAAALCGVAWAVPITTTGAALATLALGALAAAARLSIATAGLAHAEDDFTELTPQAIAAHQTFTGLVTGSAAAAAIGAALVASGIPTRPNAVLFTAVVGLVMVLRARTHVDRHRTVALVAAGIAAIAAGGVTVVISAPEHAVWVSLVALAVGIGMLVRGFGATRNVLARRTVEVLEYATLAAVLPLACWVGDLYGLVRGVSLS
ncbi:type VII secretion integral membrane protein EccD [Mycobacterium sp. OAS707]|uniref:type VII secretion integral membrane protein EccD n=1 Tax=Mycobacterium sp. OAS707 TaxID=2663822 RepID=UPI001789D754|nr:type VII secretion integral membrane protein EccD [Mycobacterium sp. OAS707]MBE1547732.1 type VII secretion integral membrane protein EccD [Mycobacterium sp. OAS707]